MEKGSEGVTWGGVVLCGGASSRMGRAKALLPWPCAGQTLIETVVATLRQVVAEVVVVSHPSIELPPLSANVVHDREPGLGPLGGIREGLHASEADLVYVTSTDAPHLTREFVRAVLTRGSRPLRAVAPRVDGYVQPLAAAYPRQLAANADDLISQKKMRPLFLLQAGDFEELPEHQLPDLHSLRNLNDSNSYLAALRELGDSQPVTVEFLGVARQRSGCASMPVPIGRLGEILRYVEEQCPQLSIDPRQGNFLVSLGGRHFIDEAAIPIGPGEHLVIVDAAAGG